MDDIKLDKDIPILPIHDSFIMHHGYGYLGDLEEAMRRSYYDIFKSDIGINEKIYKEVKIDKTTVRGSLKNSLAPEFNQYFKINRIDLIMEYSNFYNGTTFTGKLQTTKDQCEIKKFDIETKF